jgi:triacylglycerol lipase
VQDPHLGAAIAALGREISPESLQGVHRLFEDEQLAIARTHRPTAVDISYGDHPRQVLDLYAPDRSDRLCPIFVWVHGGGFLRGDKGGGDHWPNAHAGRFAARAGYLGVVINYRLAPEHQWPSGGEDVGAVVDWLKRNAAPYGGDAERIVLVGTSAGAVHVSTYLQLRPQAEEVCAAVLLSGIYGFTPLNDVRDLSYYGADPARHAERLPLQAMVETSIPLLIACSEFDPARFQAEFVGLLQRRLERHGRLPRSYVASGHNHFSLAYHLGTSDTRMADEIKDFIDNPPP